jgi:hypothetical protein
MYCTVLQHMYSLKLSLAIAQTTKEGDFRDISLECLLSDLR